jgi:hypothetical protein
MSLIVTSTHTWINRIDGIGCQSLPMVQPCTSYINFSAIKRTYLTHLSSNESVPVKKVARATKNGTPVPASLSPQRSMHLKQTKTKQGQARGTMDGSAVQYRIC